MFGATSHMMTEVCGGTSRVMTVQLTLDFDVQLLHSIVQRNPGATIITPVQET